MSEQTGNKFADFSAAISGLGAIISISDAREIVSIVAGCMAIVCGGFTSYYYHIKTKEITNGKGNQRRPKNND